LIELDGRHRRTQRSRERMLDALEKAIREGAGELTGETVAARAGVSLSTLFRHFGDLAGLDAAMRRRVSARVLPIVAAGPIEGPQDARVHELLRRRGEIFEILAPFRRQSLRNPNPSPTAQQMQVTYEALLRTQMTEALQPELDVPGAEDLLEVLAVLLSFESWDRLRRIQELDVPRATKILEGAVLLLLKSSGT
jgi:AcrR family transcriptional regulator